MRRRTSEHCATWHILQTLAALLLAVPAARAGDFATDVEPVLDRFCVKCHDAATKSGGVSFESPVASDHELWLKTLKMMRAGLMPPKGRKQPTAEDVAGVEKWVKYTAFGTDPANPDPGRVTLRRLNRTEYRNTVRDLLGVDFDTTLAFPADDTGHGFDTVADALTLSPLLLEKSVDAAKTVVERAVPSKSWVPAERRTPGGQFAAEPSDGFLSLPYTKAATVQHDLAIDRAGKYQLVLELTANEQFVDGQNDANRCRLIVRDGDEKLLEQEFVRQGNRPYKFTFDRDWPAGKRPVSLEVVPLTPKEKSVRSLTLRVQAVTVRGPLDDPKRFVRPAGYEKVFPNGGMPADATARATYVRTLLRDFATRAYRRPVDDATVERLATLAESIAAQPDQTPESGVARAMTVVLASPRFLFREEFAAPGSTDKFPLLDEFSLASRLSYFLWSSTPDAELLRLAGEGKLRANLSAQVARLLADSRSGEFVKNFAGQWLQARSIDGANVSAAAVLSRDEPPDPEAQKRRARFRELVRKPAEELTAEEKKELEAARASFGNGFRRFRQFELTGDLRRAMRQETELTFDHVLRQDRSLLELLASDYTFLNERLAKFYGIDGVTGDRMRKVTLPPDSPRGGVLTQATVLIVTSNPDRTSPVKRGLYVLDNILGVPPPPPPPDVTALEAAADKSGKPPTLKDTLARHRADPKCSSCHNRMDPIGLAFENFNALGRWRDKEVGQPIEAGGKLLTGEEFAGVRELKAILTTTRRLDYYRCVADKLFTYALGRGPEAADQHTLDELVAALDQAGGKPSVLVAGLIGSPAFQRRGNPRSVDPAPEAPPRKATP